MNAIYDFVQEDSLRVGSARHLLKRLLQSSAGGAVHLEPKDAATLIESLNFPKQRSIKDWRVAEKLADLSSGDWEPGHRITFVILDDGQIYLVDGQHRLTAISKWTSAVPVMISLVKKEDFKAAQKYYATFDKQSSVRSTNELLDSVDLAAEAGLSKPMAQALYASAQLLMNELEPLTGAASVYSHPEMFRMNSRMEVVQKWAKEAREYEDILKKVKGVMRRKLMSPGVLAVAVVTLRYRPLAARDFWMGVADNDGLRRHDPRQTFINDLLTRSTNTGAIRQRVQQPALAWNAYYQGRELKIIKCIQGGAIYLDGTPFDGKSGQ